MADAPPLHILIDRGAYLSLRCTHCGRPDRVITGYEACYRYGHCLTFAELRAVVRGRCGLTNRGVAVGVALEHELLPSRKA